MTTRVPHAPKRAAALIALGLAAAPLAFAQSANLPETVVTASRTPTRIDEQLTDATVITRAQIERAGVSSINELLGLVPGLQAQPTTIRGATTTTFIRGTNNAHTLVLVDGQRVSSATTGATALQHIPLEQIERIEVIRGPASSLYGSDAIGGVIQVFTRAGSGAPAPTASLSLGTHDTRIASVGYGGQSGDTRFHLQAGGESSEGFSDIKAPSGGFFDAFNPDRDGYNQRNLGLNLSRRVSPALELGASYLYTDGRKRSDNTNCDAFTTACTSDFDNRERQRLQSLLLRAEYQVNPDWKTSARVGLSEDDLESWLFDPSVPREFTDRFTTRQRQLAWQNDVRVGPGLLMGALEWRGVEADTTKALVVDTQETTSAVLGYQAWIGKHLLQASARRDHITRLGSHDSATLGYGYRLRDGLTARASAGTGFHAPSFNDLYWPLDTTNFFVGNPALKPERSRNVEVGLAYERQGARAAITAYRNRVKDLIEFQFDPDTFLGTMTNTSSATLKGVTLEAGYTLARWTLAASYDVLSARNDDTGNVLQRRVPRTATVDLSRRVGDKLDLGVRVQGFAARYNDTANTQRLGGYGLLALRAAWHLDRDWTLTGSVQNALDKDYTVNRSTFAPFNDYATAGRTLLVGLRYAPH